MAATVCRSVPGGGKIYVDGQVICEFPAMWYPGRLSNDAPVRIGNHPDETWNAYFNGVIDEVSFYRRALAAEEIALIYHAGTGGKQSLSSPYIIILRQPEGGAVRAGSDMHLEVGVVGLPPLTYQWYKDGRALEGANAPVLAMSSVLGNAAGAYYAVVGNGFGSVTSAVALVEVLDPVILSQPVDQRVWATSNATFRVTAFGTEPLSYRWYFNTNILLEEATNPVLVLESVGPEHAGVYSVEVRNVHGALMSEHARLEVQPLPPCAPVLDGLVGGWRGEGDGSDAACGNNALVPANVLYTNAVVGRGFYFDGSEQRMVVPDAPELNIGPGEDFTIECWVIARPTTGNTDGITTIFSKRVLPYGTALGYELYLQDGKLAMQLANMRTVVNYVSSGPSLFDSKPHHVAAVVERGSTNGGKLYVDGQVVLTFNPQEVSGSLSNDAPVRIGNHPYTTWSCFYKGVIDEIGFYRRALTPEEVSALYLAGLMGRCGCSEPPAILVQPTDQEVPAGSMAIMRVVATGAPLYYQWYKDGAPLAGGTRSSLVLTNLLAMDSGAYFVIVANAVGWVTSRVATLTVLNPGIITHPSDVTNNAGTTVSLRVVASGTTPFTYQWYKDGVPIPDAVEPQLVISNALGSDSGNYWVVVANQYGTATSRVAYVKVWNPVILRNPTSLCADAGANATLSVTAAGSTPMIYQWYKDGVALPEATNTVLSLTNLVASDAGRYYVVLGNGYGSVTSKVALVMVNLAKADTNYCPLFLRDSGSQYAIVNCAVPCADGKVLVGGTFVVPAGYSNLNLGRLNPDGNWDTAFCASTESVYGRHFVTSLGLLPDGKCVVGGAFTKLSGASCTNLGRVNLDGKFDLNFKPPMTLYYYYYSNACVVLQPDGKILVGGNFISSEAGSRNNLNLMRLHPDGRIDEGFAPNPNGTVRTIALEPDGKILIGGEFTSVYGQFRPWIARLNPDGSLDPTYNPGSDGVVHCIVVQPDGKHLVGGKFSRLAGVSRPLLGRLNPDGTLDTSFARPFDKAQGSVVRAIALQADGKVLVSGVYMIEGVRFALCRILSTGDLDLNFGIICNFDPLSPALSLMPDGSVLVSTYSSSGGYLLSKFTNPDQVTDALVFDGTGVLWLREGACPELWRTTFEVSTNGSQFVELGSSERCQAGWRLSGLRLPTNATIRASGYVTTHNSTWFVETASGPPVITMQPRNKLAISGETVTFEVKAVGGRH